MINYIKGSLAEKDIAAVTVEAHGVGYLIAIPLSTYEKLPDTNAVVKLFTHYQVREDAHKLFGFFSVAERDIFELLISINGIGPKVALAVMSGVSVGDLALAVNTGDHTRLKSITGVGPKTAQRLVMELKGKLGNIASLEMPAAGSSPSRRVVPPVRAEAFSAMISLGYAEKQVAAAVARVEEIIAPDAPVEEWIRHALQVI